MITQSHSDDCHTLFYINRYRKFNNLIWVMKTKPCLLMHLPLQAYPDVFSVFFSLSTGITKVISWQIPCRDTAPLV